MPGHRGEGVVIPDRVIKVIQGPAFIPIGTREGSRSLTGRSPVVGGWNDPAGGVAVAWRGLPVSGASHVSS